MVNRPDAVVAIDEDVLRDEVVLLQDRRAAGAVLHRVRVAVTVAGVRQVRLPIPAVIGATARANATSQYSLRWTVFTYS